MTLAELLSQMGPGNPAGMPQMAPPIGIPWEQPQAPPPAAPTPPPVMRNPNANVVQDQPSGKRLPGPPSTLDKNNTTGAIGEAFLSWLNNATGAASSGISPAMGSRGAAENQATQGGAEVSAPNNLKPPLPIFGPGVQQVLSSAGGTPPIRQPDPGLTSYDEYGNPVPSQQPGTPAIQPSLSDMLFQDVGLPERGARPTTPPPLPPLPQKGAQKPVSGTSSGPAAPSVRGAPAPSANPAGRRASNVPPFTNAPNTDDPFPQSSPLIDPTTQKFLLQTGLNLMVPQWGGPLANIGSAVGGGAEAVGRSQTQQTKERMEQEKLDIARTRANNVGLGRKGATGSSAGKRLKDKTPAQNFAAGLSPEASLYFNQRLKDLNKVDTENNETPDAKYSKILAETKAIDQRTRASKGLAKSEEIPDTVLHKIAGTPNESAALTAVAADPVQRQLMLQRLEAIKNAKAATDAAGKPK